MESHLDRARAAELEAEELTATQRDFEKFPPSLNLQLAAARQALDRLEAWCPLLQEAQQIGRKYALATVMRDLPREELPGPLSAQAIDETSLDAWYEIASDPEEANKLHKAMAAKERLLERIAELERQLHAES